MTSGVAMTSPARDRSAATDGVVVRDITKVYRPSNKILSFLLRSPIKKEVNALSGISFSVAPEVLTA